MIFVLLLVVTNDIVVENTLVAASRFTLESRKVFEFQNIKQILSTAECILEGAIAHLPLLLRSVKLECIRALAASLSESRHFSRPCILSTAYEPRPGSVGS